MASPQTNINRNPPPSNRQLLILLGIFLGFVVGVIWLIGLMINNLVWLIPPSLEQQLGAVIVPVYQQMAKESPAQDKLNQLLENLEAKLPTEQRQGRDYQLLYIPDGTVNAMALPGDRIVLYRGLIEQAASENEIMMVLGHELGHFAHRDHLRGLVRSLVVPLAIAYFIGDSSALQGAAASAANAVASSQYSQSQEREADEFGLNLLQSYYGQVAGATDFFARLSQKPGADFAFLTTHPAPGERAKKLQQFIKERNYRVGAKSPLPSELKNLES